MGEQADQGPCLERFMSALPACLGRGLAESVCNRPKAFSGGLQLSQERSVQLSSRRPFCLLSLLTPDSALDQYGRCGTDDRSYQGGCGRNPVHLPDAVTRRQPSPYKWKQGQTSPEGAVLPPRAIDPADDSANNGPAVTVVAGLVKTHTRWQGAGILGILRRRLQEQRITDLASTELPGHERNHRFRGGNGDIELRSAHAVAGSTGRRPGDLEADPPFGLKVNIFIYCGIRCRDQTRMPSSESHFDPQFNAQAAGAR